MVSETPAEAPDGRAHRNRLAHARRLVVKVGSALLSDPERGLDHDLIGSWAAEISRLLDGKRHVLVVSSGAVAEGLHRLGLHTRPESLHDLQGAAAVGQMGLIEAYERAFGRHGRRTALVLLSHDDLANRERYLNARSTFTSLLGWGVVPVINENDTVATDEIRFGDNDRLAAMVANLVQADGLILLTDRVGLHHADPRRAPESPVVSFAFADDPEISSMAGPGAGELGRGGMISKLQAARLAARSGAQTVIADGRADAVLTRIAAGENVGTLLGSRLEPMVARKRWIADQLRAKGSLTLDSGAVQAIRERGVSLLPVGVVAVEGEFVRGELVRCLDEQGVAVGQGLVNYSAPEVRRLLGASSAEIGARLGYVNDTELVHRDNLVTF